MNETNITGTRSEVINRTETQDSISFRFGGTGDEIKIYYTGEEEMQRKLKIATKAIAIALELKESSKRKQRKLENAEEVK